MRNRSRPNRRVLLAAFNALASLSALRRTKTPPDADLLHDDARTQRPSRGLRFPERLRGQLRPRWLRLRRD